MVLQSFPPMYWWRNMRDDRHNIRIRARQLQTYYTVLLSNPEVRADGHLLRASFSLRTAGSSRAAQEMIPILEAATADRVGEDGKVRARPPPRSLKSAMASAAGGEAATTEGKVATPVDLNATDSDDDADEDGEALTSGMAVVSMPDGADEEFFGNGDESARAPWEDEDEWEDTFFDGAFGISWDVLPRSEIDDQNCPP
jgi:hypothetical protein